MQASGEKQESSGAAAGKLILLCAGGTGGHLAPAVALAHDLMARGYRVALATDRRGKRFSFFKEDVPVHVLASATFKKGLWGKGNALLSLGRGYLQAGSLLGKLKPAVVVGFGGYPSLPPLYAAQRKGIPTIVHEANYVMGRANAFLAGKAVRIATSFADTDGIDEQDRTRTVVTGMPVRAEIAALYNEPYPLLDADGEVRLFVMGGSLGAAVFGDVLPEALAALPDVQRRRLKIVQQVIEKDVGKVREAYQAAGIEADIKPFFADVDRQLAKAHLVICRSGAGTVAEVTAAGRPAIFVPYPHHADQQQKKNAEAVAAAGGGWVMVQDGFTPDSLRARIEPMLQSPEALFRAAENARQCGRPDAARKLGNLVTAIASGWERGQGGASWLSYD